MIARTIECVDIQEKRTSHERDGRRRWRLGMQSRYAENPCLQGSGAADAVAVIDVGIRIVRECLQRRRAEFDLEQHTNKIHATSS